MPAGYHPGAETSSATISRFPSMPTIVGDDESSSIASHSDHNVRSTTPRPDSNVARVDLDFFDPLGVQELRRTLSLERSKNDTPALHEKHARRRSFASSRTTLSGSGDEPFDFKKTLLHAVRK